jgi:putative FmdB family regulatory protein
MPIYAYRCESCGLAKDVLQKVSDPLLTVCPACGAETFKKQVTAAGFQLKGTGWYVTDFRGGDGKPAAKPADNAGDKSTDGAKPDAAGKTDTSKPADAPKADSKPSDSKPAAPAAAPAAPASGSTPSSK